MARRRTPRLRRSSRHSPSLALTIGPVTTTVSVGVATTEDGASLSEVVSHAKLALNGAKAAGKRQWRRYKPVRGHAAEAKRPAGGAR